MNRLDCSVLHIARFTLQARTALSIGTGSGDGIYDHPIVRDANDLPMIPGTSLAGVLRHLWINDHDIASADALFGYQAHDRGIASRLEVAACALQDSNGQPAEGLLFDANGRQRLRTDPLFKAALATRDDPAFRDRVRLSHRGVAANTGKFDRGILAAGHRFSGEIRLWSVRLDDPDWETLLSLLADPRLRLGGGTRAGLGAIAVAGLWSASFDLRDGNSTAAFRALGTGLADTDSLRRRDPVEPTRSDKVRSLAIALEPRDFWRIGQGEAPFGHYDKDPDLLPKLEPCVAWKNGKAELRGRYALVPGSSVKGALAHRTAFYWNALNDTFVDDMSADAIKDWDKSDDCPGVRAIFGFSKDRDVTDGRDLDATGQAGRVLIDDAHLKLNKEQISQWVQAMIHNSIDRFTGGVRNRMLFTEELLWKQPIELRMTLLPSIEDADPMARRAFARALRDLCQGRLALGAGTTKGHGSFAGTPDAGTSQWLSEQGEEWT